MKSNLKLVVGLFYFVIVILHALPCKAQLEEQIQIDASAIDNFEHEVMLFDDEVIKLLPNDIRSQVLSCEKIEDISKLPVASQEWLAHNAFQITSEKVAKSFEQLSAEIRRGGDRITGEDVSEILKESLWHKLHQKPYDMESAIKDCIIYWRENWIPNIKKSPLGQGEIKWIWKLDVDSRVHGILHVGLDVNKRTFICFERGTGLYSPEGETLERIYREIVQEPDMARDHIGKGMVKKAR